MIKLAICDDNELHRSLISDMIADYTVDRGLSIETTVFSDGKRLLKSASGSGYDIYMLDMLMPEMNGIEIAKKLREKGDNGEIIFLTVSLDYAAASYEVDALYYLLKPIDRDKLYKVLDRGIKNLSGRCMDFQVKTSEGYCLVRPRELLYVEAQGRSPVYHLIRGRSVKGLLLRSSFSESTKGLLPSGDFAYLGPSKLINLKYVEKMDDESVLLSDGSLVYGSKAACSAFHISWESYLVSSRMG